MMYVMMTSGAKDDECDGDILELRMMNVMVTSGAKDDGCDGDIWSDG